MSKECSSAFYTASDFRLIASEWLRRQNLDGKSASEISEMYYDAISELEEKYNDRIGEDVILKRITGTV